MQHIMQIAFDFDDDKVRSITEKTIEKEMDSIIKEIILDNIAPEITSGYDKGRRNWEEFDEIMNDRIDAVLKEHKDEIIERAADRLVDSVKRTKAWKEKYKDVLDATPDKG